MHWSHTLKDRRRANRLPAYPFTATSSCGSVLHLSWLKGCREPVLTSNDPITCISVFEKLSSRKPGFGTRGSRTPQGCSRPCYVQGRERTELTSVERISVPANTSTNSEPIPTTAISTKKSWKRRRINSRRSSIEHQCRALRHALHQPYTPRGLATSIHHPSERRSSRKHVREYLNLCA
jgi:hypothetical protein